MILNDIDNNQSWINNKPVHNHNIMMNCVIFTQTFDINLDDQLDG